jgi:uncharacterized NAD-dependent epimerase/dehydratase family protein
MEPLFKIKMPYLIFLGDADQAKTGQGVRHWRPDSCVGQWRYPSLPLDIDLPEMNAAQAADAGAGTLLIGAAPAGGALPAHWIASMIEALEAGLDIASGLHSRLRDVPAIVECAARLGRQLHDVRHPLETFAIGNFAPRPGKRLLTVGTDCAVGKMYTALAVERELLVRGISADFRATGQTGILISGTGVSLDAVVSDFVSAAAATLSPANDEAHWDVIEGQGSLFHPAFAGVTLGLVHGSQADAMILCTEPTRKVLGIHEFPDYPLPTLEACLETYVAAASLTNKRATIIGISINTSKLDPADANALMDEVSTRLAMPCVDPVRTGVSALVDRLLEI